MDKNMLLSCVRLFVTPWTVAHQAPLSMEFSRQESWRGLPFPSNIKAKSLTGVDFKKLCTIGSHDVVQTGSSTPLLGVNLFIYKLDKDPFFHGVRDGRECRQ